MADEHKWEAIIPRKDFKGDDSSFIKECINNGFEYPWAACPFKNTEAETESVECEIVDHFGEIRYATCFKHFPCYDVKDIYELDWAIEGDISDEGSYKPLLWRRKNER